MGSLYARRKQKATSQWIQLSTYLYWFFLVCLRKKNDTSFCLCTLTLNTQSSLQKQVRLFDFAGLAEPKQ